MEDLGCNICFISYSEFIFGSVRGKKGDFVLVSNADAVEPDTPEGCDVAEIIELYETGKVNFAVRSVDCFLACLQFYFLRFPFVWSLWKHCSATGLWMALSEFCSLWIFFVFM